VSKKRSHIINYLIKCNKYTKYLEIGVRDLSVNFDRINCEYKYGVDPFPVKKCEYIMTSDDFFKVIPVDEKYDIIFIDGLHLYKQVLKDVDNSLLHLSQNGTIVLHDCNPISAHLQEEKRTKKHKKWNGTVWKAFALLRMNNPNLYMFVVDIDNGCGIIRRGNQKLFKKEEKDKLTYNFLRKNRKKLLKLCSFNSFRKEFDILSTLKQWRF